MVRLLVIGIVIVGLVVGGSSLYSRMFANDSDAPTFRTEKISRGDLHITVRATGTVEPEETVDVGAQVVGRISSLGKDPRGETNKDFAGKTVDYGSPVKEKMLLAQIDPAIYQAQYDQAAASLAQAEAHVLQVQAQLSQANAEWDRAQKLRNLKIESRSPTGSPDTQSSLPIVGISDADYVLAQANAETAKADVEAAKAAVLQQKATLNLAKTNLNYCQILSPISGTIIDRRVNVGQTVVSSLNAPSLFLIARDLRKMQVWTAVNEADIGKITEGTKVHFTVDARPKDVFYGKVVQVRLNAQMTQNVVIYTVVISVDNSDLKLKPYETADVNFEIEDRTNVRLVSNSALRYLPTVDQIARKSADEESRDGEKPSRHRGQNQRSADKTSEKTSENGGEKTVEKSIDENSGVGRVWQVVEGTNKVRPVQIKIGASDLAFTEVLSDELQDGDEVVVGQVRQIAAAGGGDVANPFAPPRFPRRGGQSKNSK